MIHHVINKTKMASPKSLDVNDFTASERNSARKDLLRKIEHYNKKIRKSKESSLPLSIPAVDLVHKGVMKITYDCGYAIQTKSLLVDSNTSSEELIDRLIDCLGLTGRVEEYVLQEKNHLTHEIRTLKKTDCPLNLLLQYGSHSSLLEIHLKSVKDVKFAEYTCMCKENYSDEEHLPVNDSRIIPKDEVIDHGTANVELTINEALQDLPALVFDAQERLRFLSETVASDGKPKSNLLPRHYLWDTLKPQISSLVKDIRNLVDTGEFLVTKHCPSEEFRLVVSLLLEVVTDYSRELITVTKELCGHSRARKTDFDLSLVNFIQLIRYISDLAGKTYDCIYSVAVSGHLLHVTAPENFVKGPFNEESVFTGSGAVSGVLLFTAITSYLGLVRAAYENKTDHFAALANNMLTSTNKALEKIQATNEYAVIHLHPLRSRVTDMEHKLKVSMNTLVNRVKVAALADRPLVSFLEMLLAGHQLVTALLDFLIVAQCASLLHKIVISGREVLQMPWVQGWAHVKVTNRIDSEIQPVTSFSSSYLTDQLSSSSDSVTEKSAGTASSRSHHSKERKSRITSQRESDKDMGTEENAEQVGYTTVSVGLSSHPNHLPLGYLGETGEEAHDKTGRSQLCSQQISVQKKCFEDKLLGQIPYSALSLSKQLSPHLFCIDSSKSIGVAAVHHLRHHHLMNKTITRVAEGLLLTITQSVNLLCQQCQENNRKMYCSTVKTLLVTAKHLQEEVLIMECDLVERKNMQDILSNYQEKVDLVIRDIYMSLVSVSTVHACDKDQMRLMAAATNLNELCSKIVGDALALVGDYSRALVHAEKLEQEFVALMTGKTLHEEQGITYPPESGIVNRHKRKGIKLPSDYDAESVIFEEKPPKLFSLEITPKIIGGTLEQLLQRLTYHHVVDSEFVNTFILVFHSYLSPKVLLNALIEKYSSVQEGFEIETIISVRLRVVHAIRLWLQYHPKDFNDSTIKDELEKFLKEIESDMTKCSQQLLGLLKGDSLHQLLIMPRQSSQPILPTTDKKPFVLVDCNSLELARQLCIVYSNLLKEVHLKELLTSWKGGGENTEKNEGLISGLQTAKAFSKNFSNLISSILLEEKNDDDMCLIISYFIKTAESCHSLKNYEAIYIILDGLTAEYLRGFTQGAWQGLHESQLQVFKSLQNLVSTEANYYQYHEEFRDIYLTPCIPLLGAMLQDISSICHDMSDTLLGRHDVVNFTKWRKLAHVLMRFHVIQSMPYGFTPVEVIQEYLQRLKQPL